MSVFTTRALLLAHGPGRSADRTVTALTEDFGLLHLTARAARGSAAKLGGVLEPFALTVLTAAEGRHRATAVGSIPEERFSALAQTLLGFAAAHVVVEVAGVLVAERSGDPRLFTATLVALRALDRAARRGTEPAVWWEVAKFTAHLLAASGVGVALDRCLRCGEPVNRSGVWQSGHGGLVHREHASHPGLALGPASAAALMALSRHDPQPPPASLLPLVLVLREVQLHGSRRLESVRFAQGTGLLPIPPRLARLLYS